MLEVKVIGYLPENITDPLYQYDVGQVLRITGTGLTLPPSIHFTNRSKDVALIVASTMDGDAVVVNIPNTLLAEPEDIVAYLYVVDDDAGQTVHLIRIPIVRRQKPEDWEPLLDEDLINYERLDARVSKLEEDWTGAFDDTQSRIQELIGAVNGVTGGGVSMSLGMYASHTVFNADGSITEAGDGWTLVATFNADGSITEVYTAVDSETGETTVITKTTTFNEDGSITESIVA